MAEREGFEPPIALRLCLISSQVHSTGLCHLSVLYLPFLLILDRFDSSFLSPQGSGIRFGVPLIFAPYRTIRLPMPGVWSKMGVPHDHLKRSVPE